MFNVGEKSDLNYVKEENMNRNGMVHLEWLRETKSVEDMKMWWNSTGMFRKREIKNYFDFRSPVLRSSLRSDRKVSHIKALRTQNCVLYLMIQFVPRGKTLCPGYWKQSVRAVLIESRYLLWHSYKTHRYYTFCIHMQILSHRLNL